MTILLMRCESICRYNKRFLESYEVWVGTFKRYMYAEYGHSGVSNFLL